MERKRVNERRRDFPHGYFAERVGAWVEVKECGFGYLLPAGLRPGDRVKVLAFDHGYYSVEKDGVRFDIFLANVVDVPRPRRWS